MNKKNTKKDNLLKGNLIDVENFSRKTAGFALSYDEFKELSTEAC